ncbi:MAG: protein-L-isoaspartate O-methyltransferase [Burkholderiaceae bacterium]
MDFERARHNMIEQIRPWNVLDQDVLDLLYAVRREDFVPPAYRQLRSPTSRFLCRRWRADWRDHARAQGRGAHPAIPGPAKARGRPGDRYRLDTWRAAAHRARRVRSVEIQLSLARFAQSNLSAAGVQNCEVETRNGAEFIEPGEERFDVIVVSGGLRFVPDGLLDRLGPEGRCAVIVGQDPVMWAQIVRRPACQLRDQPCSRPWRRP